MQKADDDRKGEKMQSVDVTTTPAITDRLSVVAEKIKIHEIMTVPAKTKMRLAEQNFLEKFCATSTTISWHENRKTVILINYLPGTKRKRKLTLLLR